MRVENWEMKGMENVTLRVLPGTRRGLVEDR